MHALCTHTQDHLAGPPQLAHRREPAAQRPHCTAHTLHTHAYAGPWLDELKLPQPNAGKVASLRALAGELTREIRLLELVTADLLDRHDGYIAIQKLPGIGPVLAAVIVAEIGDITRFGSPGKLCCWAGLTPRHRESGTKVIRGHVSKQGSRLLRWAVIEAIQRQPGSSRPRQVKDAIIARRGKEAKNIAKVAAADGARRRSPVVLTGFPHL